MNMVDIIFAAASISCFGAAFYIASNPSEKIEPPQDKKFSKRKNESEMEYKEEVFSHSNDETQ